MTTQDVTPADVEAAQRQAAEDAARVDELVKRVMDGDPDVTSDDIGQARRLAEFSELRVEAVRQQEAATRERRRQATCVALRPDIDAFADRFAVEAAAKLQAITDAVVDYYQYVAQQNAEREELHKRAVACTRGEWRAPIAPPAEDAGVGHYGTLLIAGRRRIDRINAEAFLGKALHLAARDLKPIPVRAHLDYHGVVNIQPAEPNADPMADLARIVKEMPEPGTAHFYRGPGGAVIERDQPYPDDEIKRLHLKTISAKEAWGI
ncbi:hypothetical protein ACWCOT_02770 [Nonomuraea bangladeshensis]